MVGRYESSLDTDISFISGRTYNALGLGEGGLAPMNGLLEMTTGIPDLAIRSAA